MIGGQEKSMEVIKPIASNQGHSHNITKATQENCPKGLAVTGLLFTLWISYLSTIVPTVQMPLMSERLLSHHIALVTILKSDGAS